MTDDVRNLGPGWVSALGSLVKAPGASDAGANGQVLVIVNEPGLGTLLFYCLTAAGFRARVGEPDADGAHELRRGIPDVVLLDARLPDRRSTEIWRQIRAASDGAPPPAVILLIAGEDDIDPRLGLDFGPCDFVVYPLSVRDLVLRIDRLVRMRREAVPPAGRAPRAVRFQVGPLELDLDRHLVMIDGAPVTVSPLEMRVLAYLVEHRDRVCTRADLLADVWGYRRGVTSRATDIHVNRLRAKLGPAAGVIETLRGTGYRLSAKFPVVMRD